jgi:DNA-binding transcriptional regulator YdaS (Cro superfamily)
MALSFYLGREYRRRRERNPLYSLRAFARDLGCDHASLSQWIRGKRAITAASADQICGALGLDGIDRLCVCELDPCDLEIVAAARSSKVRDCHALAAATGQSLDRINLSLAKLMRLGLIRMNGDQWHVIEKEVA